MSIVLSPSLLSLSPLRLHLNRLLRIHSKLYLMDQFLYHRGTGCHQLLIEIIVIGMVDNAEDLDCNQIVQIQIGEAIAVHTPVEIEIRIGNPTKIGEYAIAKSSRGAMDEHGWVPVMLIVGFKKVMELTDNMQLILNVGSVAFDDKTMKDYMEMLKHILVDHD
ncbi:hypothetical protein HAX54_018000 [Datura stramonium]|uniref:Uncharacterized protein n=1 Tax=Datura stramonium TaxID=4076 RepID=A0ABS8UMR6_DATST|nr:hypothetical protein [Datura stramonium]